jgi:septal ring factor EnvC (AmiA/AmiB activator)
MDNFINPLSNTIKKYQGQSDGEYFVEFINSSGLPVLSPYDGIVTNTRETNSGYKIKILHSVNNESIETTFENLSSINVSSGQRISKGDRVGMTGNKRVKLYIFNKNTNRTEKPKKWLPEPFVTQTDTTSSEEEEILSPKTTKKLSTTYKDSKELPAGIETILALPFTAMKKGIQNMFSDSEKANREREERKQQKELEKELKKKEEEKRQKDISPDIRFESYKTNIAKEEIDRIKELMK